MSSVDPKRPSRIPAYPLLDGHKRHKKKLVPPLNAFAEVEFVNTLDTILPEILWIGGAIEIFGLRDAINIVSEFLRSLWSTAERNPPEFFRLSVLSKPEYLGSVRGASGAEELEKIFSRMAAFYGEEWSPFAPGQFTREQAISDISIWIRTYWNRFEQPFLLMGGTVIYAMAISERMKFAAGTAPDLDSLATNFDSAEAMKAASFIRAGMMAFFPQSADDRSIEWCRKFWNDNYQVSDCEIDV